jgi:hypothetical protein
MLLAEFNVFGNCIDFQPETTNIQTVQCSPELLSGFFTKVDSGKHAFIFKKENSLFIQIGNERWEINKNLSSSYKHQDQGKTTFTIQHNNKIVFQHTYPSWWIETKASSIPALGTAPDEEEDFFAYAHFLISTPKTREGIIGAWK